MAVTVIMALDRFLSSPNGHALLSFWFYGPPRRGRDGRHSRSETRLCPGFNGPWPARLARVDSRLVFLPSACWREAD